MSAFSHAARGSGSRTHSSAAPAAAASSLALTTAPTGASGRATHGPDFSRTIGRAPPTAIHAAASSSGVPPADALKARLLSQLRLLQGNLAALQGLAALDSSALCVSSFERTERLLFESRDIGRSMAATMRAMEEAAPRTQRKAGEAANAAATAQATRQMFAALQSAIEKSATLLLAKHKQQAERGPSAAAGASAGAPGDKRKADSNVASNKRVRGGVIAPPSDTLERHSSSASHDASEPGLDDRMDQALTHVRSLQILQEKLQRNAQAMTPPLSGTPSGHSTPNKRAATSMLRSTQPHHALATAPLHHLMLSPESKMDDDPAAAGSLSSRSDDSMSSEVDSESAVMQRQQMLAHLADNVRKLKQKITEEKIRQQLQQDGGGAQPAPSMDDTVSDDPGLDDSKDLAASSRAFAAPPAVPRLNLAALTSQLGALEALLHRSVDTMSELAALQERDLAKRAIQREVRNKGATRVDLASTFAAPPASSFAARPFGAPESAVAATLGHTTSLAPAPLDDMVYTEAARSQQAMVDAVAKLSDVPRAPTTVFGSSARFDSPGDKQKKLSKAALRKQLYEKYAAVEAETKRALAAAAKTSRAGGAAPLDNEIIAALNATRPRLVQNVVMQPEHAKTEPRNVQAAIIERERERQAERAKLLGPGAYEVESAAAITQRRVTGMPSWGAGPSAAPTTRQEGGEGMDDDSEQPFAATERFVTRTPASGTLGPGSHLVSDELTTRRVTGPRFVAPPSPSAETAQAARARALQAPNLRKREQAEMDKDYEALDATTRRRVPALGALMTPLTPEAPSAQQALADRIAQARLAALASDFATREAKLEELAQTRRITQMRVLTSRRAAFLAAEEEKLERTARRLALGPDDPNFLGAAALGEALEPNHDYLKPRKPVYRFSQPKVAGELADEKTKHGASARKRSSVQLAKQAKLAAQAEENLARIEAKQRAVNAMRKSMPTAASMSVMQGRPNPQSVDARDYDLARAKDFVQMKHAPGDNWARAAARTIAEPDLDPEVDDIIGGQEGDVLDLHVNDKLLRKRVPGGSFGPKGGPMAALALGLQTLSDTELDYAAGARDDRDDPSVLYPNHDFVRKRQGMGGAVAFSKQVLGGSRSDDGLDDDDDVFPYLAEGNVHSHLREGSYAAVEAKPTLGKFAVRRELFLAMHARAKEREAAKLALGEGDTIVINPHLSTATQRHKPAASLAFSARHDTVGDADDELDDAEGLGEAFDGVRRTRGGPAEYNPSYAFKDPHEPTVGFARTTGRPHLDTDPDVLGERVDNRDFIGGIHAAKPDPARPIPLTSLPGADFSKRTGRVDREAEDKADFPDTHAEGDRLDLHPRKASTRASGSGLVNMARTTGRPNSELDAVEKEELQEGARLDLNPLSPSRRRVPGTAFGLSSGRPDPDALELQSEHPGPNLSPDWRDPQDPRAPAAAFAGAARFAPEAAHTEGQLDLNPTDAATRKQAPSVVFGKEAARKPDPSSTSNTAAESAIQPPLMPERPTEHVASVNFAAAGPRMQPLPPLPSAQSVLQPELARDFVQGATPAHPFGTAPRLASQMPWLDEKTALLSLHASPPPRTALGPSFGTEKRPGAFDIADSNKQEQSVLHPESSTDLVYKSPPSWSFDQARRFGTDNTGANSFVTADGSSVFQPRLLLDPAAAQSAVEPKSPAAFFLPHDRFSAQSAAEQEKAEEQLLMLMPKDDLVRANHPRTIVGKDARFPADLDPVKQLTLYPNYDAIQAATPSATQTRSERPPVVQAAGGGAYPSPDLDESLRIRNPQPLLPHSPAASFTSSNRSAVGRPASSAADGGVLKLNPNYALQRPRPPAHSMGERTFDPLTSKALGPSAEEIEAARKERALEQARARTRRALEESDASAEDSLLSALDASTASLSLDDVGAESSASGSSLNLPESGAVGNAASLVKARREMLQAKEEAREARRRQREREAAVTAAAAAAAVAASKQAARQETLARLAGAVRHAGLFPSDPPSDFEYSSSFSPRSPRAAAAVAAPRAAVVAAAATLPLAAAPPRRTVQFAAEDEVQLFHVDPHEHLTPQQPTPPAKTQQTQATRPQAATAAAATAVRKPTRASPSASPPNRAAAAAAPARR